MPAQPSNPMGVGGVEESIVKEEGWPLCFQKESSINLDKELLMGEGRAQREGGGNRAGILTSSLWGMRMSGAFAMVSGGAQYAAGS